MFPDVQWPLMAPIYNGLWAEILKVYCLYLSEICEKALPLWCTGPGRAGKVLPRERSTSLASVSSGTRVGLWAAWWLQVGSHECQQEAIHVPRCLASLDPSHLCIVSVWCLEGAVCPHYGPSEECHTFLLKRTIYTNLFPVRKRLMIDICQGLLGRAGVWCSTWLFRLNRIVLCFQVMIKV